MSATTFDLDLKRFDDAMVQYAAASGKDFAWVSNKRVQQSCIQAIKYAPKAVPSAISRLIKENKLIWWFAHKIRKQNQAGSLSDNYAIAQKMLKRRLSSVSFIKSFFSLMSSMLGAYTGKMSSKRKAGSLKGFAPWVKPATESNPRAEVGIRFTSKRYTGKDKAAVEGILYRALVKGINADTRDMLNYVAKKIGDTAYKYSGK